MNGSIIMHVTIIIIIIILAQEKLEIQIINKYYM